MKHFTCLLFAILVTSMAYAKTDENIEQAKDANDDNYDALARDPIAMKYFECWLIIRRFIIKQS